MNDDKMSINDLARLIQGEFVGVNKRLDGFETDFVGVDKRLAGLETDIKEMKSNSSELFGKLDEFISLYKDTKQETTSLSNQLRRLEERVAKLEGRH